MASLKKVEIKFLKVVIKFSKSVQKVERKESVTQTMLNPRGLKCDVLILFLSWTQSLLPITTEC